MSTHFSFGFFILIGLGILAIIAVVVVIAVIISTTKRK